MKPSSARRKPAAFTLVEVALALGVASFCLITVVGLVPLGVTTGQLASDQTAASSILTHVLADLRATPATSPPGAAATSTEYHLMIPAAGTSAAPATLYFGGSDRQFSFSTAATAATSRYRLTVGFPPPAAGRAATNVTLLVSWPPQVNPATGTPTGRVQVFAALDRN